MNEKKYELTEETMEYNGRILHRIKALKDFYNVEKGDLGGWIEKEDNLSHEGNCWIYGNAIVCDDAYVFGCARVHGNARVYGDAIVCDNAKVFGNTKVYGDTEVYNNARVYGNAEVCGNAEVYNNARVYGNAEVCGSNAKVCNSARISNDAIISSKDDYIIITGLGSENRDTTFFKCKDNSIKVNCGCFNGTLDEFVNKVNVTHKDKDNDKYRKEYLLQVEVIKEHFNIQGE